MGDPESSSEKHLGQRIIDQNFGSPGGLILDPYPYYMSIYQYYYIKMLNTFFLKYVFFLYVFICIYVYIYDYICIYVRAYVRTYVRMYIRMYDLLFTSPFIPGLSNQTRKLSVAASIYVGNQTIFSWLAIYPQ